MTELKSHHCPNCKAALNLEPGQLSASCPYCGTTSSVVESRAHGTSPAHVAASPGGTGAGVPSKTPMIVGLGIAGLVVVGIATAATLSRRQGAGDESATEAALPPSDPAAPPAAEEPPRSKLVYWSHGSRPGVMSDVDGDGRREMIGLFQTAIDGVSTYRVEAWELASRRLMWKTDAVCDLDQYSYTKLAFAEGKVLLADHTGSLRAFDAATGQPGWTASLGERAKSICGGGAGRVVVETTDGARHSIAVADGASSAATGEAECVPIPSDHGGPLVGQVRDGWGGRPDAPDIEGVDVHWAYVIPSSPVGVAVGNRTKGTGVPMAAGFDRDGGQTLWTKVIPGGNPLEVSEADVEDMARVGDRLVVAFGMADTDAPWHLACLDATTGERQWEVPLPDGENRFGVQSFNVTEHHVALLSNELYVFDVTSGACVGRLDKPME